jgi:hypothetical protein
MSTSLTRRGFLAGSLAAPVIITTPKLLMPVRGLVTEYDPYEEYKRRYVVRTGLPPTAWRKLYAAKPQSFIYEVGEVVNVNLNRR